MRERMKAVIAALAVSICGCADTKDPVSEARCVNLAMIRAEYLKTLIKSVNERQKYGDAETAFSGSVELLQELRAITNEVLPDGEYIAHRAIQATVIEGYEYRVSLYLNFQKHHLYRRIEGARQ